MIEYRMDLPSEAATALLAERLAPELRAGDLVILTGDLGAGKTFFAGALLHALGLDPEEPVTSPTFGLAAEYECRLPVVHADLYRLTCEEEVFELGLEERRVQGALLVVEWGRPYASLLGGDAIEVELVLEPRAARILGAPGTRSSEIAGVLRRRGPPSG